MSAGYFDKGYLFWVVNDKRTSADSVAAVLERVYFPCNQLVALVILTEPFVRWVRITSRHTTEISTLVSKCRPNKIFFWWLEVKKYLRHGYILLSHPAGLVKNCIHRLFDKIRPSRHLLRISNLKSIFVRPIVDHQMVQFADLHLTDV